MIGMFAKENGTSIAKTGKMGVLCKMRDKMERVFFGKDSETGLHMPVLQMRDTMAKAAKRLFRSRAAVIVVSAVMMTGVYRFCAVLAYLERGYKAYGGECLAAMAAGVLTYKAVSYWANEGR